MNVVHVVESLDVGGLEHMVLALAAEQRSEGHSVRITCLWRGGAMAQRAIDQGIEVVSCDKAQGLDWTAIRRLRRHLQEVGCQVVHTHNAMAHYYAAAALLAARRVRLVNTRHGMGGSRLQQRGDLLYRLSLRRTDAVACVCEAARRHYVTMGLLPPQLACVVRNGIDLSRFSVRNPAAGASLKAELGLPADALVLGTVGRLTEVKQQHRLMPLVAELLRAGREVALVIVGDGEQRTALERITQEAGLESCVRLLGARADVPRLLAGMDVFALPSSSEGYSLALVEAAASGLPILATDVGGNAEIVQHGRTGLLVPADDDAALLAAALQLVADRNARNVMGASARQWALDHGSLRAMGEAYMALYGGMNPVDLA